MKPPVALLALGVGALLATAFGLYDGDLSFVPALSLAGFALVVVSASGLTSALAGQHSDTGASSSDGFRLARTGAAVGAASAGLALAGVDQPALGLATVGAMASVLWGAAKGLAAVLPTGWRSAAAARIGRTSLVVMVPLALVAVLDIAGTGPAWTSDAAAALRIAAIVVAAWFASFCVVQREAVVAQPAA